MIGILNGGALFVMTSIGHRIGLFDTLATLSPATSCSRTAHTPTSAVTNSLPRPCWRSSGATSRREARGCLDHAGVEGLAGQLVSSTHDSTTLISAS